MMYITVRYKNEALGQYAGQAYTYKTDLPLRVGDQVIAPTYRGDAPAIVAEINVPESRIDERILPKIRAITAYQEAMPDGI